MSWPCLALSHQKRTLLITIASDQVAAAIEGFFWPKIFWDFLTKNLDGAVKPIPALQSINLVLGLIGLAWEWPLKYIADTRIHRSIEARLAVYPISVLAAVILYQGTNSALYYLIGIGVYVWAYSEGEVSRYPFFNHHASATDIVHQIVCGEPWSLPKRTRPRT